MIAARLAAADVQRVLDRVPFVRTLGLSADDAGGALVIRMPYMPGIVGNARVPALHGGALASLMAITAQAKLLRATGGDKLPRVFSITAEYLRSAALEDTLGTAAVVTRSRRFANLRVELRQPSSDRVVAAATVQFLLAE